MNEPPLPEHRASTDEGSRWGRIRPYLLLSFLCALLYLPGLTTLPPTDRDEARFAQATRQMLESGDYVDIRFQERPRHKKPAGIYWLQAAAVKAVGSEEQREIWPHRLPSVLGAWLAVLLVFAAGRRLFDRETALLGAAILGGSLMLVGEAHIAKTDAVLLATVVAAQAALARVYLAGRDERLKPPGWGVALVFWTALGVGALVKGPITPLVALLTSLALCLADRRWRWLGALKPVVGIPLMLAIAAPWAIAIHLATDGAFYSGSVGADLGGKLLRGQESHGAPPGYHALLILALLWPGSLFVWPSLVRGWRERTEPAVRFCLAWLIPTWILFELVPTKLPHYVLPAYPALALLTARGVLAVSVPSRGSRIFLIAWAAPGLAIAAAVVALPVLGGDGFSMVSLIPAAAAVLAVAVGIRWGWRGARRTATLAALGLGSLVLVGVLGWVMPHLSRLWLARELAEAVELARPAPRPAVAVAGFAEPSVVFLLGTETRSTDGAGAAIWLVENPGALVVVDEREEDGFREALAREDIEVRRVETLNGINYSKGHELILGVYERRP